MPERELDSPMKVGTYMTTDRHDIFVVRIEVIDVLVTGVIEELIVRQLRDGTESASTHKVMQQF
jgi:hypothetical protein